MLVVLTCFRQESANERYHNTVNDLLLPITVSQKDEKPHTARLEDTAVVPHIKITELPLENRDPNVTLRKERMVWRLGC